MKLSVAMITYNHEKFIVQALDSVLMQEVDFDYEIVIGDDLSQDRTREILLDYQAQYPEKIRLLFYETKQGVGGNICEVLTSCQGEYIALLEGDDYWIASDKLQLQIDFLEANPDFVLSFHTAKLYSEEENRDSGLRTGLNSLSGTVFSWADLTDDGVFPVTCSVVYRRSALNLPQWVRGLRIVDVVIFSLLAQNGLFKYVDQVMSVYRIHNGGIWSGSSVLDRHVYPLPTFEHLNRHYQFRYADEFKLRMRYAGVAQAYRNVSKIPESNLYFRKFLYTPHGGHVSLFQFINVILSLYLPHLRSGLKEVVLWWRKRLQQVPHLPKAS